MFSRFVSWGVVLLLIIVFALEYQLKYVSGQWRVYIFLVSNRKQDNRLCKVCILLEAFSFWGWNPTAVSDRLAFSSIGCPFFVRKEDPEEVNPDAVFGLSLQRKKGQWTWRDVVKEREKLASCVKQRNDDDKIEMSLWYEPLCTSFFVPHVFLICRPFQREHCKWCHRSFPRLRLSCRPRSQWFARMEKKKPQVWLQGHKGLVLLLSPHLSLQRFWIPLLRPRSET